MDLVSELADVVGEEHVVTVPERRAPYEIDLTRRFGGPARAVVAPATTAEVAAVVAACDRSGAAVVPQGGNTGLVGGGVPRGGEILLRLGRLDAVEPVDAVSAQVTVGAGATLESVHEHVRASGFDLPIDHGARSAATIGGMVATNAGGTYAMRYGTMRALTAGLELVTADGRVVDRLGGLLKDNAGYDLAASIVGSEGTLAIVTRVRLRLVPRLPARATALLAFEGLAAAASALPVLRAEAPSLVAADFFLRRGLELVCRLRGLAPPFPASHGAYLVVECAAASDPIDELAEAVDQLDGVADVAVAADARQRASLWAYRELHNEVANAMGIPHKFDVSVRPERLPAFADEVVAVVGDLDPEAEVMVYGHLGDGNVHVNVVGPAPDDARVDEAVLGLVADFRGSISAEHGVGVAKARYLHLCRSAVEIDLMRRLKTALDPNGTLNPGCVLT